MLFWYIRNFIVMFTITRIVIHRRRCYIICTICITVVIIWDKTIFRIFTLNDSPTSVSRYLLQVTATWTMKLRATHAIKNKHKQTNNAWHISLHQSRLRCIACHTARRKKRQTLFLMSQPRYCAFFHKYIWALTKNYSWRGSPSVPLHLIHSWLRRRPQPFQSMGGWFGKLSIFYIGDNAFTHKILP